MQSENAPIRTHPEGAQVDLWVVPATSRTEVAGRHAGRIRIRITDPPEDEKTNRAVADLLKKLTGARQVSIERGHRARAKTVVLAEVDPKRLEILLT